jgi:uncharacterized membrane protein YhhN
MNDAVLPSAAPPSHTRALAAATAASAALAIAAGPGALALPWLLYLCKPLTTLLVIAHAWPRGAGMGRLRQGVRVGLVLSLIGDVALMWPKPGFLPGLVAFLLAHLSYTVAFTRDTRLAAAPAAFGLYALVAGGLLVLLWPGVPGPLQVPVLAYVACLSTMAAQAAARWWVRRDAADGPLRRRAAIGAALFVCSDALLAFDRFHAPLPAAGLWILGSYWLAQWCIASALARPRLMR